MAGTAVMIEVKSIDYMRAYVSLLEYDDVEGMIPLSELSYRHIEPAMVLTIDSDKGCIVLSKRHVSERLSSPCEEERYDKSKLSHSAMRRVADML